MSGSRYEIPASPQTILRPATAMPCPSPDPALVWRFWLMHVPPTPHNCRVQSQSLQKDQLRCQDKVQSLEKQQALAMWQPPLTFALLMQLKLSFPVCCGGWIYSYTIHFMVNQWRDWVSIQICTVFLIQMKWQAWRIILTCVDSKCVW